MKIRLNKLLATRGVAARRKCDALIESGAVRVNGEVITAPGAHVDPDRDDVQVNGRRVPRAAAPRYFVLNKPVGMISTLSDPQGRRSLREVLPPGARVFPVGRLDADTSGLLLLTSDGELAHHLMHPRYGVEKLYRVVLRDPPQERQLERLRRGVVFEPGVRSAPARVRERDPVPRGSVIEVAIAEGRYRQVRRMCEAVGLEVVALHRWGYGPLRLGELERGMWRELSEDEVRLLRAASARPKSRPASVQRPRGRRRGEGIAREREARPARGRGDDPFEVARRGPREDDVTGWPDEVPEGVSRDRRRGGALRRPRPAAPDPARRRAETSRGAMRRFGIVPGAEMSPRGGPRRRSGPGAAGDTRSAGRPRREKGRRERSGLDAPGRGLPGRARRERVQDMRRRDTTASGRRAGRDAARSGTRPERGATGRRVTGRGATGRGATGRGATGRGATERGATGRGATGRGATGRGATGRGATGRGATGRGATGRGGSERGGSERGVRERGPKQRGPKERGAGKSERGRAGGRRGAPARGQSQSRPPRRRRPRG